MKKIVFFLVTLLLTYNISFAAEIEPTCKRYFDGCNNCSRSVFGGEMACTMMACAQDQAPKCLEYFTAKTMHPSWDNDQDGLNDCEKDGTCDDSIDYTLPKSKPCTREYMPVCAQPPMPVCPEGMMCIQVMPQVKTYGNKCSAEAENAQVIYSGECLSSKVEVQVQNALTKALEKVPTEKQTTLIKNAIKRIDLLLPKDNLGTFKISVLNYIKSLLQAY